MKLTNLLSSLILEEGAGVIPVTNFVYDGYLINLTASYHQWKERQGIKSLDEIVEIYEENSKWINTWRKKHDLSSHITSNRKFEWQGRNQEDIYKCLIQFRPSGIRCKEPNYVPAFVALTQTRWSPPTEKAGYKYAFSSVGSEPVKTTI